jgi:hypothetical protein
MCFCIGPKAAVHVATYPSRPNPDQPHDPAPRDAIPITPQTPGPAIKVIVFRLGFGHPIQVNGMDNPPFSFLGEIDRILI